LKRRWTPASYDPNKGGPTADAIIDHPAPQGIWNEVEHVPLLIAPDPGGVAPRAGVLEFHVEAIGTPVQHSPITNWSPGTPYPGPPAKIWKYIDLDSIRFWGKTGQGKLVWSEQTEFSAELPPPVPQDLVQHVDTFQGFWGGFPSMARNRPSSFGDQVPVLNPALQAAFELAPG
jgi:hypothetical protein